MTKRQNPSGGEGLKEETAERKVSSVISESLPTINPKNVLETLIVAIFGVMFYLIATVLVAVAEVVI